jgi:hypothetical protein
MRTTLSLDPDVAQKLQARMASENASFKQVVNDALRRGLNAEVPKPAKPFRVTAHSFGLRPGIDIHKLNQLADDLEIEAFSADATRAKKRR